MDHLPIPPGTKHAKLLFLGNEEYDGKELVGYPGRKKWKQTDLRELGTKSSRTQDQVDAFFQTWLFFGCLIAIFGSVGVKVRTEDFVSSMADDGKKYLTTANLPGFLEKWRATTLNGYMGRKILSPVGSALEDHRRLVDQYCGADSPVSSHVAIAIVTLHWTLSNWRRGIGHSDWKVRKFHVPYQAAAFLRERMMAGGWCKAEIGWLMREMELDGLYYVGCLRSPRYEDDHSNCDDQQQECGYTDMDWKYETRHVKECSGCEFVAMPINTVDIIRGGQTPVMSFVKGQLCAVGHDSGKRYVAISHVWSDGMGNEKTNALPTCQLERLQNLSVAVDECQQNEPPPLPATETCAVAYSPSESSESGSWTDDDDNNDDDDDDVDTTLAGFWVDTLCVPIKPADLRSDQISKMRRVYRDASSVLVLDRCIEQISSGADVCDKFAWLRLSNWQRRLWTCQEGVFARSLYFQFHDGPQRLLDLTEEAGLRKDGPLRSTIPALSLDIPAFNEGRLEAFDLSLRVLPILMAVRTRNTTKKEDETVCIATLLGLDPGRLLRINKDTAAGRDVCECRMEEFISMVENLPQGLIFHRMERLSSPGFRWAPRTFLGQRLADDLVDRHNDEDDEDDDGGGSDDSMFLPGHGLFVKFPAYFLSMNGGQASLLMVIGNAKKRFNVRLHTDEPSLRLLVDNHGPDPTPRHRILKHRDYAVGSEKFVLVMSGRRGSRAVFCAMDTIIGKPDFVWPVHKLRYICPATVEARSMEESGQSFIRFKFHKTWEWVIG